MNLQLSLHEARVVGCLIEKQITTPEQYPLSLNSLTNACNQKSNRDPVLDLDEASVQGAVDQLIRKFLVSEQSGYGSRVAKFQQRFCNSEYGLLKFSPQELGIICELLLRGPQTPGELRTRASRLCRLADVEEVEAVLKNLAHREDGPFVVRLARQPGRRDSRYGQLFTGEVAGAEQDESPEDSDRPADTGSRRGSPSSLEQRVAALEAEVAELKRLLGADAQNPA